MATLANPPHQLRRRANVRGIVRRANAVPVELGE